MRTPEQRRELTKQRRQAVMSAGVRLPRRRVMPHQLQPTAIERAYYRDIIDLIDMTLTDVREKLVPRLPSIIDQYLSETRVDAYGDTISTIFDDLRLGVARTMTDPRARALGDKYAVRTNAFNALQVDRQFKTVLGISVLREEPWLQPKMGAFSKRNARLIKSIPEEYLNNLETVVNTAVERGVSTKALEKQILSDMNIKPSEPTIRGARRINPKARARLIARDQIGKYNSSLTQLRQTEIGIEKYIWSTAADDRVRDEHEAVNGNEYSWKKGAPELGGLNPGEDIQCRCSAIPVMDKFFGEGEVVPIAPEPRLPIPIPPKVKPPVPVAPIPRVPKVKPVAPPLVLKAAPKPKYKKFKRGTEEGDVWGKRKYQDWRNELTAEEFGLLDRYTDFMHKPLNEYLRTGALHERDTRKGVEKVVNKVTKIINKAEVPENVIAYRGIAEELSDEIGKQIGKIRVEKTFMSTSLDSKEAGQFGHGLLRMKIPKGTKGAYLEGKYPNAPEIKDLILRDEKELLLQRGIKYKIIKKGTFKTKMTQWGETIRGEWPLYDVEVMLP